MSLFFSSLPNILSALRIILTPIFLLTFFGGSGWFFVSIFIFTCAALTDTFDGYYARRFKAHSSWGAFLDPLADKILIDSTLFAFWIAGLIEWWVLVIIIARDILVTLLRVQTTGAGGIFKTSFLAKCKTTAQFLALYLLFFSLLVQPASTWYWLVLWSAKFFLYGVVFLTLYSGFDYFFKKS